MHELPVPGDDVAADAASAAPPLGSRGGERSLSWPVFSVTWIGLSALTSAQVVASSMAMGTPLAVGHFARTRAVEMAFGLVYGAIAAAVARRAPPARVGVAPFLVMALAAIAVAVAAVEASYPLLVGATSGGRMLFKASLFAKGVAEFLAAGTAVVVATLHALGQRLAAREAQAAQLEARLADARLQALASQLQPHFLFNTLTAISVIMHRDPAGADTMLTRLADLLRATLRSDARQEVPLSRELDLLGRYLDIMRVRFGDRLRASVTSGPDVADVLVPAFLLQPVVENALEHGLSRRPGDGHLAVRARRAGDALVLEVEDDGIGLGDAAIEEGVGLSNVRRRLAALHGERARLVIESVAPSGARVTVTLPARTRGGRTAA